MMKQFTDLRTKTKTREANQQVDKFWRRNKLQTKYAKYTLYKKFLKLLLR